MTQLLSIVWPPLDDTSNRQLSDAFLLWSGQRDYVGSENNIYSFQAENQFRMVTLKRLLTDLTVMIRICVKKLSIWKRKNGTVLCYLWSFLGLRKQKENQQRIGGMTS